MLQKIPSLNQLVHELSRLPGIGPKTAQRLAYHLLRSPGEYVQGLRDALKAVKERIRECPQCFAFTEEEGLCHFCADPMRVSDSICVVEDPADIERIESSGVFRGRYHVLHGAISPLDGVSPQDLKIEALLDRLAPDTDGNLPVSEVILALDADLEGDTTVLYLAKILKDMNIKTSRIAHGVPIGGDIDYIDYRTLGRAIENRVQV
ncbi:MAG TPA: recombination mediator RecR [Bdellovibrionales bacterium]|jgi:recombination protein RecR|nr:recombination mediator RecR [Bdellovibrionales bacterium]